MTVKIDHNIFYLRKLSAYRLRHGAGEAYIVERRPWAVPPLNTLQNCIPIRLDLYENIFALKLASIL